jgi:hypothetical protein|tara:strand:+ start:4715 stop:8236 length:3522 start_codon:yes stop_codon:yes gene_type:complete
MSSTDRQSRLLVSEDWKRIYQSFRNADFQSYDFDNLRRTMVNYLRQNYPEDFNDYIESSEYLALIDMIAFLGQNLSFRIDLNARENFLETAERRESVLRLARMLSYNPKRNQPANGILKLNTIKTTEPIIDSTGQNLANVVIKWNDQANASYFEQFLKILNSSLPITNQIGNPLKSASIANVITQQYRFNATNTTSAVFPFTKRIEGVSTRFEVVSAGIANDNIIEEPPIPGTSPGFLFRDDGQGAGSSNTGFFMYFKQGKLDSSPFSVANPVPNQSVAVDVTNINDTDIWLYNVDSNGFETDFWTKIDSTEGNNVIYNNLFEGIKNVYAVSTRVGDRINLVFSDGVFGNVPSGNFKVYYRSSANSASVITPGAMGTVSIDIPYQSKTGALETMSLGFKLNYTVTNASASETNEEIKSNAPATYYTQNRLITGEDYNIGPLAISQEIIKTKSTNRISSGISRYFDLKDVSGKYSNTSLFADDGCLYKEIFLEKTQFTFTTQSDIEGIINNTVEAILSASQTKNFYLDQFPTTIVSDLNATWTQLSLNTNRATGRFLDSTSSPYTTGTFTANSLRYIEPGAMCRFTAPTGFHFMKDGTLMAGDGTHLGASSYKWAKVISVAGDGTIIDTVTTNGPISFNDNIPTSAILDRIIPNFSRVLVDSVKVQMIDQAFAYKDFGLRYDLVDRQWKLITTENINTALDFSTGKTGDTTGQNLDSSWLLYFKTDGETYTITYRNLKYVIESADEIRFYFDGVDKVYNPATGQIVRDKIDILNINTQPGSTSPFTNDYSWSVSGAYRDPDGYIDSRKIEVQFIDLDDDGVVDDPEIFEQIVAPNNSSVSIANKLVFQKKYTTSDGVQDFKYFSNTSNTITIVTNEAAIAPYSTRTEGQVFYLEDEKIFKILNKSLNNTSINSDYKAFTGRDGLKFHYVHVADSSYRIDPSASNLIDTYLLTKSYDTNIRKFVAGEIDVQPLPQSNDELYRSYGSQINKIKSISDEVIYYPAKYKILFGNKAQADLQVKFKIVKNKDIVTNDNELKSDIVQAINRFFAIENWDFGETFYFQELSAYIMTQLTPKLSSILIVPNQGTQAFGSLFEIKSEPDEIFINAATVADIEAITEITAKEIQASGTVISSVATANATSGITSSASTVTATNTTGGGLNISSSTTSSSTGSSY